MIDSAIDRLHADGIGLPDYAINSCGATIAFGDTELLSKTYEPPPSVIDSLMGALGLVPHRGQSPSDVIDVRACVCDAASPVLCVALSHTRYSLLLPPATQQPDVHVGKCWPMDGDNGRITVQLGTPVKPTSFTLDHAHHSLAQVLASAARDVEVWVRHCTPCCVFGASCHLLLLFVCWLHAWQGYASRKDKSPVKLASYTYDVDGGNTQTFPRNHNKDNDVSCAGQWFANKTQP